MDRQERFTVAMQTIESGLPSRAGPQWPDRRERLPVTGPSRVDLFGGPTAESGCTVTEPSRAAPHILNVEIGSPVAVPHRAAAHWLHHRNRLPVFGLAPRWSDHRQRIPTYNGLTAGSNPRSPVVGPRTDLLTIIIFISLIIT